MKKILVVLSVLSIFSGLYAALPLGLEFGAGYSITTKEGHPDYFFLEASGLIQIYENFYARAGLLNVSFISGESYLNAGTGVPIGTGCIASPSLDIMMFFNAEQTIPYALAGLLFSTGGGWTQTNFRIGGGAEFLLSQDAHMRPFVELLIDINHQNPGAITNNVISAKGGIRIK
ncbi:MAG: hypothetical protein KGZ86_01805 [Candidatus Latescibacteria bacterium]|nr:hypothetical protein [Candidatus Latescibacterota bacterium]